jgi:hypothetical protein
MAAENQTLGSGWRGWGVRMGMVSMMAATGMLLAGHAAQATTVIESLGTQADGGGEGLLLDVPDGNGPDGNSGTTGGRIGLGDLDNLGNLGRGYSLPYQEKILEKGMGTGGRLPAPRAGH